MKDFSELCILTKEELSLIEDALKLYHERHRWDIAPYMQCLLDDLQHRVKLAREWMEQLDRLLKEK